MVMLREMMTVLRKGILMVMQREMAKVLLKDTLMVMLKISL